MRYALVNPPWTFDGSIYFGCREPHLPLEYGYAQALLESAGHEVLVVDAQLEELGADEIRRRVRGFRPHFTVVTSAPSYLFWRCAPPELRVPQETARLLRDVSETVIAVGPHASTTPRTTLRKVGADAAVLGECEEILPKLAGDWSAVTSLCYWRDGEAVVNGGTHACDMNALPALHWPRELIARHRHHHHRFEAPPEGPGAEIEASRGCPYHCTFCAKDNFRDDYRRRPLETVLEEIEGLAGQGVEYIYFIDEIFLPNQKLLESLVPLRLKFGVQTRIDLWTPEMLELLSRAGCVSVEAGVESITEEGRALLDKKCKLSTDQLSDRLIFAKRRIPFVQANLLEMEADDLETVEAWRARLQKHGVWANKPVPLFVYPGSPEYTRKWGDADDQAWERAHNHYLEINSEFSDIQEQKPASLVQLELDNGR
ncbi:MAG TPA: TIGR04295 family B12-binding domain-containing radical SAM protein [Bryobacteraceae bacterium]|jgi:B12-binding domain/radical SAM domain protein of rhizo-twelve system